MANPNHVRSKSDGLKRHPAHHTQIHHLRSSRPQQHKRTHSTKHSPVVKQLTPPPDNLDDYDNSMAASFTQYCFTCEKQLVIPNNDVLYCSERCRKRDSQTKYTPSASEPNSPISLDFQDPFSGGPAPRNIVPPRSPTQRSARNSYVSLSSASEEENDHHHRPSTLHSRQNSEAAAYLRQFQIAKAQPGSSTSTRTPKPSSRPAYHRASTSTTVSGHTTSTPSLSHTPTSTASLSMPFTPVASYSHSSYSYTRPLPPRHPHSSSYRAKSIDLVTPHAFPYPVTAPSSLTRSELQYSLKSPPARTETSKGVAEGELRFEKACGYEVPPVAGPGSLGRLFGGRG